MNVTQVATFDRSIDRFQSIHRIGPEKDPPARSSISVAIPSLELTRLDSLEP